MEFGVRRSAFGVRAFGRGRVRGIKSISPNDGKGDVLEGHPPAAILDATALQPRLAVASRRGRNKIMVKKLGADSANLSVRRKGEATGRLLAAQRVRFPLDDDTPPAVASQPEAREYRASAVIGDNKVRPPSDIVPATFTP